MGGAVSKKVTARIESRPMVSLDYGAARWWCGSGGARVLWENGGRGRKLCHLRRADENKTLHIQSNVVRSRTYNTFSLRSVAPAHHVKYPHNTYFTYYIV